MVTCFHLLPKPQASQNGGSSVSTSSRCKPQSRLLCGCDVPGGWTVLRSPPQPRRLKKSFGIGIYSLSRVATRSKEVQKGGPSYFLMQPNPYDKPHATAEELVAHLRDRGLQVARPNIAARKIDEIGYERHFQNDAFADSKRHNEALQKVLLVFTQSKDQRAKHYRATYTEPPLPPIWMLKEFLTFGTSARLYAALSGSVRTDVAAQFGITSLPVFDSWVPGFVDLRNVCAHHDRLFNRRFQKQPQRLRRASIPVAPPPTLKAQIECLDYALTSANAGGNLVSRVQKVLNRYPEVQNAEVGY